jgi:hypothetical protein
MTLNGTLLHAAQAGLPFGGVGPSGIGAYGGYDGFKRFSHARSVHEVGRFNITEMLRPPYGLMTRIAGALLTGRLYPWSRHSPPDRKPGPLECLANFKFLRFVSSRAALKGKKICL